MPIKIKSQKDVLSTRVVLDLPTDLNAVDQLMRASKATGTIVATYNQGGLTGVNIEQNTHVAEKFSEQIRGILGVGNKVMG